jgi:hypothetical protein
VLTFCADVGSTGHELLVIIGVSVQVVLMDHEPHLMSVFEKASGTPPTSSAHPARAGDRHDRPGCARKPALLRRLHALPWAQVGPADREPGRHFKIT